MALASQPEAAPSFDDLPHEMKREIFSYLDGDNASLYAVIQMNKACYSASIGMMWRSSTQRRLAKVPTTERRQHYANMIHRWDLNDDTSCELFDGLNFPLLKNFAFSGGSLSVMQLRRCLQAGLHTLRLIGCVLDVAFLENLASSCTQLVRLVIGGADDVAFLENLASSCTQLVRLVIGGADTDGITPDQFVTFLQSFSALRCLGLHYITDNVMERVFDWESHSNPQLEQLNWTELEDTDIDLTLRNKFLENCTSFRKLRLERGYALSANTIIRLMRCPLLETLHIKGWLRDDDQLQQRFGGGNPVIRPFPSIKDLSLSGEASAIKAFLSTSPQTLITLNLNINDNFDNILPTVSLLSNLVRLEIVFDGYREFSRADLDYISKLSKLQKCYIEWAGPLPTHNESESSNNCPWLTDRYFRGWISKLPQLRQLHLALDSTTITQAALQFLADCCPSLLKCSLLWEHDINTWTSLITPLFPQLEDLRLGKVRDHGWHESPETLIEDASRDMSVIRSLVPKLKRFNIGHSPPDSSRSSRQWNPHEKALRDAFLTGV